MPSQSHYTPKNLSITPLSQSFPLCEEPISAGFPSPAEGYIEKGLDLNDLLIQHPHATFFVRVQGDSMLGAGIQSGDLLVVDRALEPSDGKIIVAVWNGEFTVKRLRQLKGQLYLMPENKKYSPIRILEEADFQVWGVVTYVIHRAE